MPDGYIACEKCVPRGCSCNLDPVDGDYDNGDPANWAQPVDDKGRQYPCCEWEHITEEDKQFYE